MRRFGIERWIGIAMVVTVLAVYSQVAEHGFIDFDDGIYILNNAHVRTGLTSENIRWALTSLEASNWHPLTWISHMLDCQVYGLRPAGHHLTSLFLHVANCLLLFLVLRTATGDLWRSALAATLFGLHPLHIESVAWVSERKDVLSSFFWMLTILAYLNYARRGRALPYMLALMLFAFGLMCKPMLVTLPFVLLLLDLWPLGRFTCTSLNARSPIHVWYEKIPFLVLSVASCVVTYMAQSRGKVVLSLETVSLVDRIMNGCLSYVQYLLKLIWPHRLAIFYPHPGSTVSVLQGLLSGVFLILVSVLVVRYSRQRPSLFCGWFWYLGTLVPVIGILQVGVQAMADRYTYLPSIGLLILLIWSIPGSLSRGLRGRLLTTAGALSIVICLSVTTWCHLRHWESTETVFRHALRVTRNNHVAHYNLGNALLGQGRSDAAVTEYQKALDIWPDYPDVHNNLGLVRAGEGKLEDAISHYRRAIRVDPRHMLAQLNLADALGGLGRFGEALALYRAVLADHPEEGVIHNRMGVLLAESGRMAEAEKHLRRAVTLCRDCPEPLNNLGRVLMLSGSFGPAARYLKQAIAVRPDYAEAYNNLGLVRWHEGDLDAAAGFLESALAIRPAYAKARANLNLLRGAEQGKRIRQCAE